MPATTRTPPNLTSLILLSGLSVASLNMFLPSLTNIASTFEADYAVVNLSIAGYAAMTAILQLIMGPLSDRFGRRPVILTGLALFTMASLACALATNVWVFLSFRMLQAAIISGYTVSLAVIRDTAGPQQSASLMGYMATAWAIAPMLAPVLGGGLDELFGWRASFWVFLALGFSLFVLSWCDLGETNSNRSASFTRQFETYTELIGSRRFWGYAMCMTFSTSAFYAFLAGVPLVASEDFGMAVGALGIAIGSITAGFVTGSLAAGLFAKRLPLATTMIAGRIVACAGPVIGLMLLAADILNPLTFFACCIFVGIGNGITMPASNSGAMSVRPDLAGSASGLAGALTVAGGAGVSAVTGAILTKANGPYALLGMMLLCSVLGLISALHVRRLENSTKAR